MPAYKDRYDSLLVSDGGRKAEKAAERRDT
jgi:hypothetical protein